VNYVTRPFGGPEQVLKYLARYTHRIAISNRRLVSVNDQTVTFNYKDYAHGNRPRSMTLDGVEFLRRFLMHEVPTGFMRIRHFGLLANRVRARNLALCRSLLSVQSPADCPIIDAGQSCPVCQRGRMISGPNLSPMQLRQLSIRLDSS
jgi:Putative transposase